MIKKLVIALLLAVSVGVIAAGAYYYRLFLSSNIQKSGKLFIPNQATFQQMADSLQPFLKNQHSFLKAARIKQLASHIHAGRYTLSAGMSNNNLIDKIRSGEQDEIAIRIGNYSSIQELAGKIAPFLECDSQQIVQGIRSAPFTQGVDSDAVLYFFVPNTYQFHWNLTGSGFAEKMKNIFDQFWTPDRKAAAKAENMTLLQVTTLASIVQLESAHPDEQPKVARLYLNRLKIGMKLDADPTVIFAMRKAYGRDIKIDRVYYKNLLIPSPYNTYRNNGLPPGPICMPNASAIDAVLHPANHDYLYFVADPSRPGYHIYAHTLAEQTVNAQKYRKWIQGIQKQDSAKQMESTGK